MSMKPTLSTGPEKTLEPGLLERRAAVAGILGDTKDMLIVTGPRSRPLEPGRPASGLVTA